MWWLYPLIGLSLGLWASRRIYRFVLKDGPQNDAAFTQGFACFAGLATIFVCTILWPLVLLALVLRRFVWRETTNEE